MRRLAQIATAAALLPPLASAALADETRIVRRPTVGCYDQGLMQRARSLREDDRVDEARGLIARAIASGACRPIRPGLAVDVQDGDILNNLSKVRAGGEPGALWIRTETLDED